MDVLKLLANLEIENEKSCNDAFQFFMAGVIESIYIATGRYKEEFLKEPPDPAPIINSLYKHRNVAGHDGSKIRTYFPMSAFHEYAGYANLQLDNGEFISGHFFLAYICARLALRHHARGHAEIAALYAHEAIHCINFIHWSFPSEGDRRQTRTALARHSAYQRHKKTYAQKDEVITFWKEHIPPETSNEKAGEWLKDSFPKLSVRKLSEYVSQAKKEIKELPPAGKA